MIAELQQLHDRLTEAERANLLGRERQRIAGALHDRIEQEIFMIGVRLSALLDSGVADPRLAHELQELRQLSADASDEVRRVDLLLDRRRASREPHRRYSIAPP